MSFLGMLLSSVIVQNVLADDGGIAVCDPDTPIIIEQSHVKLLAVEDQSESTMYDETVHMVSAIFGDSVIRLTNNGPDPMTITVQLYGDGFGFAEMSTQQGPSTTVLPGWSSIVVPLNFQPSQMPTGEEQMGVTHGRAIVSLDNPGYEDYFSEVYLTGFSVTIPGSEPTTETVPEETPTEDGSGIELEEITP